LGCQIGRYLGSHGISAQEAGEDNKGTLWGYAGKILHHGSQNLCKERDGAGMHHDIYKDHEREQRRQYKLIPQEQSVCGACNDFVSANQADRE